MAGQRNQNKMLSTHPLFHLGSSDYVIINEVPFAGGYPLHTIDRTNCNALYGKELYHEDFGDVLWWNAEFDQPPYVGTEDDSEWANQGELTFFSFLPARFNRVYVGSGRRK